MADPGQAWNAARRQALEISSPGHGHASVMRSFLNDPDIFKWPNGTTEMELRPGMLYNPYLICTNKNLDAKRRSKKSCIWAYKCTPDIRFKHTFAVKRLLEDEELPAMGETKNEIEILRDLRYPHVAALLGTFMSEDRLSILIFPAACFDMGVFMDSISNDMQHLTQELQPTQQDGDGPDYNWPLRAPLDDRLKALQSYFYCLTQALRYLHEMNVRHKDIKPANILIDLSGSVVLTDFGISKKFLEGSLMRTTDGRQVTREYAAPEALIKARNRTIHVPSTEKTDIFSLGCVFLEMASLLYGIDLQTCRSRCGRLINEDIVCEYAQSLDNTHAFVDALSNPETTSQGSLTDANFVTQHDVVRQELGRVLPVIRQMLNDRPEQRPAAEHLCNAFYFPRLGYCSDCNPDGPNPWSADNKQLGREEEGRQRRGSQPKLVEIQDDPSRQSLAVPHTRSTSPLIALSTSLDRASHVAPLRQRATSPPIRGQFAPSESIAEHPDQVPRQATCTQPRNTSALLTPNRAVRVSPPSQPPRPIDTMRIDLGQEGNTPAMLRASVRIDIKRPQSPQVRFNDHVAVDVNAPAPNNRFDEAGYYINPEDKTRILMYDFREGRICTEYLGLLHGKVHRVIPLDKNDEYLDLTVNSEFRRIQVGNPGLMSRWRRAVFGGQYLKLYVINAPEEDWEMIERERSPTPVPWPR